MLLSGGWRRRWGQQGMAAARRGVGQERLSLEAAAARRCWECLGGPTAWCWRGAHKRRAAWRPRSPSLAPLLLLAPAAPLSLAVLLRVNAMAFTVVRGLLPQRQLGRGYQNFKLLAGECLATEEESSVSTRVVLGKQRAVQQNVENCRATAGCLGIALAGAATMAVSCRLAQDGSGGGRESASLTRAYMHAAQRNWRETTGADRLAIFERACITGGQGRHNRLIGSEQSRDGASERKPTKGKSHYCFQSRLHPIGSALIYAEKRRGKRFIPCNS